MMKKTALAGLLLMAAACIYLLIQVYTYFGTGMTLAAAAAAALVLLVLFFCGKKKPLIALVLEVVLAIVLAAGVIGATEVNEVTEKISTTVEYETVQLVCLKDSGIKKTDSFADYDAGYLNKDTHSFESLIDILETHDKTVAKSRPYRSTESMYDKLQEGSTELMIITSDIKSDLMAIDEDYQDKVKVLFEMKYELGTIKTKAVDIEKEPFTIYLCGADLSSGEYITSTGRGDVNILLTVNPNTKKVNLQVIPRDTFVYIPCRGGSSKLSYSGWWGGVQSSIDSIEDKFDIEINYFAKINFNGLTDLVDALGGVTVYSHYTYNTGRNSFVEGENFVDGEKALDFARARKMLPENERSRGYHQMELVKGIFRKFAENPTYENAMKIMDGLSNNFVTNLPKRDYRKAVALVVELLPQLQTMENHTIQGEYLWHYDEVRTDYYQYYFYPNDGEIEAVKERIDKVING